MLQRGSVGLRGGAPPRPPPRSPRGRCGAVRGGGEQPRQQGRAPKCRTSSCARPHFSLPTITTPSHTPFLFLFFFSFKKPHLRIPAPPGGLSSAPQPCHACPNAAEGPARRFPSNWGNRGKKKRRETKIKNKIKRVPAGAEQSRGRNPAPQPSRSLADPVSAGRVGGRGDTRHLGI